jgi:hypothetical protein
MNVRRGRFCSVLAVTVCLIGQLPWPVPAAVAQQLPGEWRLISTARWDRPIPPSMPGDGSMGIRVFRFDERGGEAEAHIELATAVCARGGLEGAPGPRGEVEIIYFKWTFTAPILRLRPGDPIPVAVETRVRQASQRCPNAGAFRTTVYVVGSESSLLGNSIPAEQRNQFWGGFSYAFQPVPPGVRFNFEPSRQDAASGQAVLRAQPHRVPAPNEPQRGWFGINLSTNATRGGGEEAGFFYMYEYSAAAVPVDQAAQDMARRASRDSRFGSAIVGSLGVNTGWGPDWELRWMDFAFSNGRQVRLYHATSKANRAVRYTIYVDPDRGTWTSWEPVA